MRRRSVEVVEDATGPADDWGSLVSLSLCDVQRLCFHFCLLRLFPVFDFLLFCFCFRFFFFFLFFFFLSGEATARSPESRQGPYGSAFGREPQHA